MSRFEYDSGNNLEVLPDADESQVFGMYKVLNESGRLEQIRAQLRREIFTHLLDSNKSANSVDIDLLTSTPGRLSLALVAGFVRRHFPASFSVFIAEANLAWLPIDENEALLLHRLGIDVPSEELIKEHKITALESTVKHLLKLKLDSSSRKDNGTEKVIYPSASWQPFNSESKENQPETQPRPAESILSDMRTLIREELSRKPEEPKATPLVAEPKATPLVAESKQPQPEVSGLDESRLQEYIGKMVERMMGSKATVDSKPAETVMKSNKKEKKPKKKVVSPSRTLEKQKNRKVSSRQISFRETETPQKEKRQFEIDLLAQSEVNPGYARSYGIENMHPVTREPAPSSDLLDAKMRLQQIEQEAAKLESTYNQKMASLDTFTSRLLDRIGSNSTIGRSNSSSMYRPASARPAPVLASSWQSRIGASSAVPGGSTIRKATAVEGLGSARRRSPIQFSVESSATKKSVFLPNTTDSGELYRSHAYDQSRELLTSLPKADYKHFVERTLQFDGKSSTMEPPKYEKTSLPFSVYPNGDGNVSLRHEFGQVVVQSHNTPTRQISEVHHSDEHEQIIGANKIESPLVIDNKRMSRDIGESKNLPESVGIAKTPEGANNLSNTSNFFSPSILGQDTTPKPVSFGDQSKKPEPKPEASPEFNRVEEYIAVAREAKRIEDAKEEAAGQQYSDDSSDGEAEEVEEDEDQVEADEEKTQDKQTSNEVEGKVDDVLQKYMQMVLEKREAAASKQSRQDDDDEPATGTSLFRPKSVSAVKTSRDDGGDTFDDFW